MTEITQTSIAAVLAANARNTPSNTWLTSPDTGAEINWQHAEAESCRIACCLDAMGLAPGAPVAVAAQNSIWSTLCFTGIVAGGYVATPLNLVAGARVLSYVLDHSGVRVIFCTKENKTLVAEAAAGVEHDVTIIPLDPDPVSYTHLTLPTIPLV